jgi:predicted RNA binding protein with dsRBD fold (UPF0201 family)
MSNIVGTVRVEINPTEDIKKVKTTLNNLFNYTSLNLVPNFDKKYLIARIEGKEGLKKFHERLRQQRILNAARKILRDGVRGNSTTFYLNKQVAYVNHISFCEPISESPLGPISVEIQCEDVNYLIDWLTLRSK